MRIHILNITNLSTMFTILVLTQTAAASNLIFNVIIIGWVWVSGTHFHFGIWCVEFVKWTNECAFEPSYHTHTR